MISLRTRVRDALISLGAGMPASWVQKGQTALTEVALRQWMAPRGMLPAQVFPTRTALLTAVASSLAAQPVLYLEFGVAKGESLRLWSSLLTHPDSRFIGFDSFEGLPEAWSHLPQGHFSTQGQPPQIADSRISYEVGWFDQTLPTFTAPQRPVTVIALDADLYSSTQTILKYCTPLIQSGTYLYFDEFASPGHEERALREWLAAHPEIRLRGVGASGGLWHVVFQVI